jgi:cytochrome b6-f complex iron-sulfur subunit
VVAPDTAAAIDVLSRRAFLRVSGGAACVVALSGGGCGNDVAVPPTVRLPVDLAASSPTFGQIAARLDSLPALASLGGALTVEIANRPAPGATPFNVPSAVLIVHRAAEGDALDYICVDSVCPHAGCPLGYSQRDQLIECRAVADPALATSCSGDVVHLPAVQPLATYRVFVDGEELVVDLQKAGCIPASAGAPPTVVNGAIAIVVAQHPELVVGGVKIFTRVDGYPDPIALLRVATDSFVALNAKCTHMCCTVAYDAPTMGWLCPCHGSRYAADGTLVGGPSRFPLVRFATSFDGTTLTISSLALETMNDC